MKESSNLKKVGSIKDEKGVEETLTFAGDLVVTENKDKEVLQHQFVPQLPLYRSVCLFMFSERSLLV